MTTSPREAIDRVYNGFWANEVRVRRNEIIDQQDLLNQIDREARGLGVTRQAFIKARVADAFISR